MLAEFVVGFDIKQVPPEVIERARVAFIDTIGVAVAGSHEEVSHIVAEMVKAEGSAPQCTIVGQSLRASPQLAALANGVANHAMDYDFTFLNGQSVAPVIPALLPVAEVTNATPADVLGAFIVGCEVAARIMRSSPRHDQRRRLAHHRHRRRHRGGGGLRKLMKLPVDKVANAIGISVSLASGLPVNYGTMTKPLHCGNAARNGVMAAMLASKDFTSHAAAFEGNNGFYRDLRPRAADRLRAVQRSRQAAGISSTTGYSIKYYPSGGRGHTAIEAALMLRDKIGSRLNEISNIHCWVSPSSAKRVNADYPPDVEAAKFSAAYVIAYSLVHGIPKIKAFTPEALKDERIRAMAKLVTAGADPNLSDALRREPDADQNHAQRRPDVRAAARLPDRLAEACRSRRRRSRRSSWTARRRP